MRLAQAYFTIQLIFAIINFFFYLQYFQQKVFNFSKISESSKVELILLFSLFLLLFMGLTTLFGIIYRSHCIILANFYFYLQYF